MLTLVFLLCLVVDIYDCFIIGGVFLYLCVFFSLFGRGLRFAIYVLVNFYLYIVSCVLYNLLCFGFWLLVLRVLWLL